MIRLSPLLTEYGTNGEEGMCVCGGCLRCVNVFGVCASVGLGPNPDGGVCVLKPVIIGGGVVGMNDSVNGCTWVVALVIGTRSNGNCGAGRVILGVVSVRGTNVGGVLTVMTIGAVGNGTGAVGNVPTPENRL